MQPEGIQPSWLHAGSSVTDIRLGAVGGGAVGKGFDDVKIVASCNSAIIWIVVSEWLLPDVNLCFCRTTEALYDARDSCGKKMSRSRHSPRIFLLGFIL